MLTDFHGGIYKMNHAQTFAAGVNGAAGGAGL